eukprot:1009186-Pelagomonas_calceolata.AAC.1
MALDNVPAVLSLQLTAMEKEQCTKSSPGASSLSISCPNRNNAHRKATSRQHHVTHWSTTLAQLCQACSRALFAMSGLDPNIQGTFM